MSDTVCVCVCVCVGGREGGTLFPRKHGPGGPNGGQNLQGNRAPQDNKSKLCQGDIHNILGVCVLAIGDIS